MRSVLPLMIIAILVLAGCGQKGSLYLPDEPQDKEQEKHQGAE